MSLRGLLLFVLVCFYILVQNEVQSRWNISTEENLELEQQLKLLNKPPVKTIVNEYGDIHDCVDVYKQPAFDNPLLKDHTIELPIYRSEQDSSELPFDLVVETCPVGTVPIRRLTKDDLIREKLAQELAEKIEISSKREGFYSAGFRTVTGLQTTGAATLFSIHKPRVLGKSFSTSRIHIKNGPDSIEAGWRVDPFLYGDRQTRFFLRTDVGNVHCFNIRCAGFIQTSYKYAADQLLYPVKPGQKQQILHLRIKRLPSGNWALEFVDQDISLGYWPKEIFTRFYGLVGEAEYLEWGAVVYSPPGAPLQAQMGSGVFPQHQDMNWDAYFALLQYTEKSGAMVEATRIEPFNFKSDSFFVNDLGSFLAAFNRSFSYGSKYDVR